ncbi:carboxypeptidase SOL1 isoform X2 [Brassica napus]|uniref:carboxypeptidase SOL1 isoform X2 n=1 Tax=Brassica napus TaxID=3708 RepID=UPI002078F297|nr:carboxypeptidase SOL1 isoform X2 [Brassica napus]
MIKLRFVHSLLFFTAICFFLPKIAARGGHSDYIQPGDGNASFHGTARHLFAQEEKRPSVELTRGYMTNADLEKAMKDFTKRCSKISRLYKGFLERAFSIGKSVNGFALWVIEISDKPGEIEAEPAFKYIGNVHGDEPVGRELLLRLANWICDNYEKDPLAKLIVENVHLHILPSLNPDGFSVRRRNNANNVDLNRDFPDQFFPINEDLSLRQPETTAIMNWLREIRFTASATLHGGALVANFPWDGTEDKRKYYYGCPDDQTFRFLARLYSKSHRNMSFSIEFEDGITNGASWYPIYGGMQDWNYIHGGCFELTLEISDNKWPRASELPTIWEYNRKSMLKLVASLVKTGVHGRIFSLDQGKPLPGLVVVKGINYTVKAHQAYADYHRLLEPGKIYEVTASSPGYKPKTTSVWLGENAVTADFILIPEASYGGKLLRSSCDCSYGQPLLLTRFFTETNNGITFALVVVVAFLFFLLQRRVRSNLWKQRQSSRRSTTV